MTSGTGNWRADQRTLLKLPETVVPDIPKVAHDDAKLQQFMDSVREVLQVREGNRGNPLDQMVTVRDLINGGIADMVFGPGADSNGNPTSGPSFGPPNSGGTWNFAGIIRPPTSACVSNFTTPPAPVNLVAEGGFGAILLAWGQSGVFGCIANTQVWRSNTDNIGTAIMIGTTAAQQYSDVVGNNRTYYYWVRNVSFTNQIGPYNGVQGTRGQTALDPSYALQVLNKAINESQLSIALGTRLDHYGLQIVQLDTQYTVKIDNNGYVTGFGLASEPVNGVPYSRFIIRADQFAIGSPTTPNTAANAAAEYPFVFNTTPWTGPDGTVYPVGLYLKAAFIADATIKSAKIQSVNADIINTTMFFQSPQSWSGKMYGSELYLGPNGQFNTTLTGGKVTGVVWNGFGAGGQGLVARLEPIAGVPTFTVTIQGTLKSPNYLTGVAGWVLYSTGDAEINNVVARGDVYANACHIQRANFEQVVISNVMVPSNTLDASYIGFIRSQGRTGWDIGNGFFFGHTAVAVTPSNTAIFAVGNGDPRNTGTGIIWDGTTLTISGTLRATNGVFSGTLTACDLHASNIWIGTSSTYSGTIHKDNSSGLEIWTVAAGAYITPLVSGASVFTDANLLFGGPNWHGALDVSKRIRNSGNGVNVPFQITCNCVADHFVTLWYRINSGVWQPIDASVDALWPGRYTTVYTPADSYDLASISVVITTPVSDGDTVQFGVSPTDTFLSPLDDSKVDLRLLSMSVVAINT